MAMKAKVLGRAALEAKLDALVPRAREATAKAKLEVAKEAARQISAAAPRASGDYASSIKGERQADNPNKRPTVGGFATKDEDAAAVYADYKWRWLEFGTAPHAIKPKTAPALKFKVGDRWVSASQVSHPGTEAQPHIFTTWRAYRPKALRKVRNALNKAVREAMGKM